MTLTLTITMTNTPSSSPYQGQILNGTYREDKVPTCHGYTY